MNYIESVEISGFWGNKNVSIKLHENLNFLIGPNGSGKTTIINLISAVLRGDVPALYNIQFEKVTVRLKTIGANRKPIIEVAKSVDKKMGNVELLYNIREKSGDKGTQYGVEGPFDDRIYSDSRLMRHRRIAEVGARLSSILSDFVEINWLSIHRTNTDMERRHKRDDGHESSIDHKLYELSGAFSSYFSFLSSKAELESKNFQEQVFLSLLDQEHSSSSVFKEQNLSSNDKETVVGVLRDLGISRNKATKSVNSHFAKVAEAQKRLQDQNGSSLLLEDAFYLSDSIRVSKMIAEWRRLQVQREAIFQPRIKFEKIINSLFSGKEIHFDERNIPMVHLSSNDVVDVKVLSSGEKQLFILLGEALLQEGRSVIFISDEPELSLHVKWQSTLFENIRSLNSSCQILSATHSPDIVGAFQDHIIHVEDCISDVH